MQYSKRFTPPSSQDRDRPRTLSDWATDQDLVPEPADEVEEGAQDGEYERHAHAPDAPGPGIRPPPPSSGNAKRKIILWLYFKVTIQNYIFIPQRKVGPIKNGNRGQEIVSQSMGGSFGAVCLGEIGPMAELCRSAGWINYCKITGSGPLIRLQLLWWTDGRPGISLLALRTPGQCSAGQCRALQWSPVQCMQSKVHCTAVLSVTEHCGPSL